MNLCIASSGDFFSDYGGGQVYVRNLVEELIQRTDIQLFVVSKTGRDRTAEYKGVRVYEYSDAASLRTVMEDTRPDVVHANGDKHTVARQCKSLGIPCVVTVHHGGIVCPAGALLNTDDEICRIPAGYSHCLKCYLHNTPTGLFWYPLLRRCSQERYQCLGIRLKKLPSIPFLSPIGQTGMIVTEKLKEWQELCAYATHFIAPSNAIAEALQRNGCHQDKISVIPHGIPTMVSGFRFQYSGETDARRTPSSAVSQFTIHNSQFIEFYYVGRINYVKGIHVLLKAFSGIENTNTRLHLIGGAQTKSEQRYMKKLQRQYRKDSRIVWHGKKPYNKLHDTVKGFHCLAHPAIYLEVFGLDISEALAMHKYVIATRCGGAEMQIHDYNVGMLVEPNNVAALRNAMLSYLSNPVTSNAEAVSIQRHADQLLGLLSSIVLKNKQP